MGGFSLLTAKGSVDTLPLPIQENIKEILGM